MSTSTYLSLTVDLPEREAELLESLLHDLGALGLEVRDAEAPPMPGVRGPKSGEAIVVGYFESKADAEEARARVAERFAAARAVVEAVPDQDWSNAWKSLIKSVEVGRLWVGPPWEQPAAPKDKVQLVIEPKMAFGTGDHPTTSLCLEAVDGYVPTHPGCGVLDVGTGTGVLAIAAKRLGAGRVVGLDNDPMSVTLAKENAELNGAASVELSGKGLESVEGTFELVLANILANTLVELAPKIAPKVADRLFLAGVLVHQKDEVLAAYTAQGLRPAGEQLRGEWIRLDLARRGS